MTLEQWLKLHKSYERFAYPVFRDGLKASYQPLIASIQLLTYDNYKSLTEVFVNQAPLQEAYLKVYTKVGLKHGNIVGKEINSMQKRYVRDIYESDYLTSIYEWVATNLGKRITDVNDYTIELIQRVVEESLDRSYTVSQMRAYLERTLNSPKFNRMRALRIARTETTTAANFGAMKAAESSDIVLDKEWISVIDDRTRHQHLLEDGQKVGQYDKFTMADGTQMLFPGDQSVNKPSQVVNCRCGYNFTGRRDADGMLIFKQ